MIKQKKLAANFHRYSFLIFDKFGNHIQPNTSTITVIPSGLARKIKKAIRPTNMKRINFLLFIALKRMYAREVIRKKYNASVRTSAEA